MAVLEQAMPLRDESGLVFPSPVKRGRPLSDLALTKILRSTGLAEKTVVHGFRSSFRDWCAETGKPRELAPAALAHTVGGVEGAYFRSDLALTKILRSTGLAEKTVVHGFRSSFRDWCAETGKPRELAPAALAHTVGGVEGAYFRSDLFERRRLLMDQWAAYLTGTDAEVVRLHG